MHRLVTPPTAEPISTLEAVDHVRPADGDESTIDRLIRMAREYVEAETGRALITQTWETTLDAFPRDGVVLLAGGRLQSVASVKCLDPAGVEQTLAAPNYVVDAVREPGRIVLAAGKSWPSTADQPNAVRVRYVVGYGDSAEAVPEPLRQAMLLLVSHFYEHREPEITGTITSRFELGAERLLSRYRIGWGF